MATVHSFMYLPVSLPVLSGLDLAA
jgi:hypothetical protein